MATPSLIRGQAASRSPCCCRHLPRSNRTRAPSGVSRIPSCSRTRRAWLSSAIAPGRSPDFILALPVSLRVLAPSAVCIVSVFLWTSRASRYVSMASPSWSVLSNTLAMLRSTAAWPRDCNVPVTVWMCCALRYDAMAASKLLWLRCTFPMVIKICAPSAVSSTPCFSASCWPEVSTSIASSNLADFRSRSPTRQHIRERWAGSASPFSIKVQTSERDVSKNHC
mmetsp:Transcript_31896/g.87813  ORF Transcript_31896/g.87813 Transcript_31896/m.87813 type:complete len:224 (-) Transcript_31896:186-857(-)